MSSKNAIAEFADEMLKHFPPFRQWEDYQEKAWAETLEAELSGFSAEVIKAAQKQIIRTRKPRDPRPPMVSECIDACLEARRFLESGKQAQTLPEMRSNTLDWSADRLKLARDLVHTEMGRQAAKEGWAGALFVFARKNQRLPDAGKRIEYRKAKDSAPVMVSEVEWCKREAKDFDDAYEYSVKGGWDPAGVLEKLGRQIIERRQRLEREVLAR